jgi:tape measure domain-containing protein
VASIDDRIVSMKFDNASFESKLGDTIKSLDNLKRSLDFANSKRGLDELSTAGKNFNMTGLTSSIEGVSAKFLAMSTVAITALVNITEKALTAGAQVAKAFTLTPVIQGFHEYETQLESVQTILANTASKGTTLDQVNDALQKLNTYSDQTIYNFGQMAKNIGTFTAAGVDLDKSVTSIKGIANIAAMSGSSADQASTAMYQLSQAIASGSLKLMDWNSVVNAGMGGEAFKSALFETGKAMNTLKGIPMEQTFQQWTDSGHSFRDSLQDGWITADVLTTTLSAFSGDMTEEMLLAKGFSQEQATGILKQAEIAKAAATEVKTFTQLLGTIKEAVGTGWADSFKIVIGNFTEAKKLWSGVNNVLGQMISRSSDSRNAILQGWKDFGGRATLIHALADAFHGLMSILAPIKFAFRGIFPETTAATLLHLTASFAEFTKKLKIGGETTQKIHDVFRGLFAVLSIGWEIIKGVATVIKSLFDALSPARSGFLDIAATVGNFLYALQQVLVKGGAISDFFASIAEMVKLPIEYIGTLKDAIVDLFSPDTVSTAVTDSMGKVGDSASHLTGITDVLGSVWERLQIRFQQVASVLGKVWEVFKTFVSELGSKIADAFGSANFDKALDVINVGLLGGILIMLRKFFKEGFKFDIGSGLIDKMYKIFEQLTGVLKALQTQIKAKALLDIAIAMAVLTASLVVLSLIDSGALTKALTAMSIGFAQLVGVLSILDKFISSGWDAGKLTLAAGAMILLSVAIGILAISIKILSTLSPSELGTGLIAVGAGLAFLVAAIKILNTDKEETLSGGFALLGLAAGLFILSLAVKSFADMSWEEMAKGLVGVGIGLAMLTYAMNHMEKASILQKGGFAVVAYGLKVLADAVALFGAMDWGVIFKGLMGIGGALLVVAGTMHLMPTNMLVTAPALIAVAIALGMLGAAVQLMGGMDLGVISKGVLAFLAMLLILAAAMEAMQETAGGAVALIVVAGAMAILMNVLKTLGEMEISTIIQGLVALAATLLVLGGVAFILEPVVPALLGLGIALSAVGIGIALFGIGAMFLAKSFEIMANSGVAGAKAIVESIDILMQAVPKITLALSTMLVGIAAGFLEGIPQMTELITKALGAILDAIIKLIPKAADAVVQLIDGIIKVIEEASSKYVEAGLSMIMSLLKGIRDNIGGVVTVVGEIITNFIDALAEKIPDIVNSLYNLFISVATELAYKAGEMQTAFIPIGIAFLDGLLAGLSSGVGQIFTFFSELPGKIINIIKTLLGISSPSTVFLGLGSDIINGLFWGLVNAVGSVWNFFVGLPGQIIGWIGNVAPLLISKGWDIITGLINGIGQVEWQIINWFTSLGGKVIGWIGDVLSWLKDAGTKVIRGFLNGIDAEFHFIVDFFSTLGDRVIGFLGDAAGWLKDIGSKILHGLWDGIESAKDWLGEKVKGIAGWLTSWKGPPKKDAVLLVEAGRLIMHGLWDGLNDGLTPVKTLLTSFNPADHINVDLSSVAKQMSDSLSGMDVFNPVITPVLDLTKVEAESRNIENYMRISPITPDVSFDQARLVASLTAASAEPATTPAYTGPTEVTFEQNIYAPTQLSTNDIYRNTKSQIALAREELGIK